MNKNLFLVALAFAVVASAQQPPDAANYAKAAELLRDGAGPKPLSKPAALARKVALKHTKSPDIVGTIANDPIEVRRQIALSPSAQLALSLSENWLAGGPQPVNGPGGRVLYTYGQGVPTIVCAILQVCELDLEPGEVLGKNDLDWGDNRFEVTPRTAGSGADEFTYLVVKPTQPGLDTTMTIGTNKRPYYVRLVSTDHEHMARVAFSYPDEEAKKLKAELEAKKAEDARQKAEADRLAKLNTAKPIRNWNYTVQLHGKDAKYLRPDYVGDDGIHTHIALTEEARHRGLPVVQISDARGPIPANAHWDGNELVIDAVFERACLLEGVGKKQQRACISNNGLKDGSRSHGD